jgi:hypothetical protein
MKHRSYRAVCIVLLAFVAVFLTFGDEDTVSFESRILDYMDGNSNYTWRVLGSKFATKTDNDAFPKVGHVAAWPRSFKYNGEGDQAASLGIWGRFDRQGYNWIDIYPVAADGGADAEPTEIPIPGRVQYLDMWVWGSNLHYTLEAYVRDYTGVVHVINMGDIGYEGWKDLRAYIPRTIPQNKRVLPRLTSLTLVKFRLWTRPSEPVNDFQVYFAQLKVLSDTFEHIYDGDDLADPAKVQELWAASSGAN